MVLNRLAKRPEEDWSRARLIPTTGIGGQDEQERRATSSLLAVMQAVPEFGRAITRHLGAPSGRLSTYTEVRLGGEGDKTAIPDGALVVEWGRRRWACLVEVKTGSAVLDPEQLNRYLDAAKAHGFDGLLTISSQITASPEECPVVVDSKRARRTTMRHLSWWQVLTEARVQHRNHRIQDTDQDWILGELIAYLDHPKSGAGGFDDMGEGWVRVREAAPRHGLRTTDPAVQDVASRWEQFVQYTALGLCSELDRRVTAVWPKHLDPGTRLSQSVHRLVDEGTLEAVLSVPDAAASIRMEANLATRLLTTTIELDAPKTGKPKTRIKWVVRQLADAPENLRLDVIYPNAKETSWRFLKVAREKPEVLLYEHDPGRDPRRFRLSMARPIGAKRGKGPGSFVSESSDQVRAFYRTTVQHLRAWSAPAPKLDEPAPTATRPPPDKPAGAPQDGEVEAPEFVAGQAPA